MTPVKTPKFPARYKYTGTKYSGGQADVYVCIDNYLERQVAIKVVKNIADIPDFHQEVAAIKSVSSRHIAELYDLISINKNNYPGLVEEFVPGTILTDYHKTNSSTDHYLKTLFQIACGISDMHAQNKIHRDIKPNNIKFDEEGIVKILDFGIACNIEPPNDTVASRGTLGYRAPELYNPPVEVTPAVDTYAFGATAWFIADGKLPKALLEKPPLSTLPRPTFSNLSKTLPDEVIQILDQTFEINPLNRPSMVNLRDILEKRLLYGKHRAEFVYGTKKWVLDKPGIKVTLGKTALGNIAVQYDGVNFVIRQIEGNVYVNNTTAKIDQIMPNSCVVTIGHSSLRGDRLFIPFNVSHPEVVL